MEQGPISLTAREAASGLLGSVSMTCWFFLLVRLTSFDKRDKSDSHLESQSGHDSYLTILVYRYLNSLKTTATATQKPYLSSLSLSGSLAMSQTSPAAYYPGLCP